MRFRSCAFILLAAYTLIAGIPRADVKPGPAGLLQSNTLFNVYGRGFSIAPILGLLGTYRNFSSVELDTRKYTNEIKTLNGGKPVITGLELI